MTRLISAAVACFLTVAAANATSFSNLVIFGDSLSDNGNAYLATGGTLPSPPNYTIVPGGLGRFTDGPDTSPAGTSGGLWHEVLAGLLGVPVSQPFLLSGGTNYAVGGAQVLQNVPAVPQPIPSLGTQVQIYLASSGGIANPNALYVFWGGANDLYSAVETTGETPAQIAATEHALVPSMGGDITALASAGARYFLWLDLPQLASTPRGALDLLSAPSLALVFGAASAQFRSDVAAESQFLAGTLGVSITDVDIYALYQAILTNPGAFGYTNVTTPADLNPAANPDRYLFWDIPSHPTTTGHALIGETAYASLQGSTAPEPATWSFVGTSLALAFCRVARSNLRRPPTNKGR